MPSSSSSAPEASRPVEYYISRATDPFMDGEQRTAAVLSLCEKINDEAEAAQIAVNVLAHRILTPNQDEALFVLQTVEALMQHCGSKVHTKIGKYRFLNQLVKLVSPKHNGNATSVEVRDKAIQMMFVWQKQMRHIEKFKEVYDNLREHNVIRTDPCVNEDEIPTIPPPPPKLAPFEDEEKAQLLQHLLKSNNPTDLQAANRLIKTLVRTDEMKTEKVAKRLSDMDKARRACECMEHLLFHPQSDTIVNGELKSVHESLLTMRPVLFKYAGEAAENNDDVLADILSINDQVNRLIQRYQSIFEGGDKEGRSNEERDLLGCELSLEEEITGLSSDKAISSSNVSVMDDVNFIGVEPSKSSQVDLIQKDVLSDLSSLLDVAPLFSSSAPAAPLFVSFSSDSKSLLQTSHVSLDQIRLNTSPPIEVISSPNTRVFAHMATVSHSSAFPVAKCVLVTIMNLSPDNAFQYKMEIKSRIPSVSCQLQPPTSSSLKSFSIGQIPISQQVLLISSNDSSQSQVDLDLRITYINPIGLSTQHEGSFRVHC